jgi:hypothetical protein
MLRSQHILVLRSTCTRALTFEKMCTLKSDGALCSCGGSRTPSSAALCAWCLRPNSLPSRAARVSHWARPMSSGCSNPGLSGTISQKCFYYLLLRMIFVNVCQLRGREARVRSCDRVAGGRAHWLVLAPPVRLLGAGGRLLRQRGPSTSFRLSRLEPNALLPGIPLNPPQCPSMPLNPR